MMNKHQRSAHALHQYVVHKHWNGSALVGPDPGIGIHASIGRFIKSYSRFLPWHDDSVIMQAQGYWILDNWLMYKWFGDSQYRDLAVACTDYVAENQNSAGYWECPSSEPRERIATAEGCFATLGLLETHTQTQRDQYLLGARRWYDYVVRKVRFQEIEGNVAINASSSARRGMVPYHSTLALQTFARLAEVTGNSEFLDTCPGMVRFLRRVQLPSGELPYAVTDLAGNGQIHFRCYQYNAAEFMHLTEYYRLTGDAEVLPVVERLAGYLASGLTPSGAGRYACGCATPEVLCCSAAIAQALGQAIVLGLGGCQDVVNRAYEYVLRQQRPDGGFAFHSRAHYRVLQDRRSYPRYLSMILNHLLREYVSQPASAGRETTGKLAEGVNQPGIER